MIWVALVTFIIAVSAVDECSVPYITQYIPIEGKQLGNNINIIHNVSDIDSCRTLCNPRIHMVPVMDDSFSMTQHVDNLKTFASFMYNEEKRMCIVDNEASTSNSSLSETFEPEGFVYYERRCFNISESNAKMVEKTGKSHKTSPTFVQFGDGSRHPLTRVQLGDVFDIELQTTPTLHGYTTERQSKRGGIIYTSSDSIWVMFTSCHYNLSDSSSGTNTTKTVELIENGCPTSNLNRRLTMKGERPVVYSTSVSLFNTNSSKLSVQCRFVICVTPMLNGCANECGANNRTNGPRYRF